MGQKWKENMIGRAWGRKERNSMGQKWKEIMTGRAWGRKERNSMGQKWKKNNDKIVWERRGKFIEKGELVNEWKEKYKRKRKWRG